MIKAIAWIIWKKASTNTKMNKEKQKKPFCMNIENKGSDFLSIESKKNTRKWLITIVCLVIACIIACGAFFAYKLYKHEKDQAKDISDLKKQVNLLSAQLSDKKNSGIWDSAEYN